MLTSQNPDQQLTDQGLLDIAESPDSVFVTNMNGYCCLTQSTERAIKMVTEANGLVSGSRRNLDNSVCYPFCYHTSLKHKNKINKKICY